MKSNKHEHKKNNFIAVHTNFIIRCHNPGTIYRSEHFYILNKGLNSGKPLNEPCANCFVVVFKENAERESYYWLAYSLWKSKFWHKFIVGSVIPFLRINEFKERFFHTTMLLLDEHDHNIKNVQALRLLEQKEKQFHENIALINDMRNVILYRYVRAH